MKILSRLFCKHKYEYFHRNKYTYGFSCDADQWHYICKNCGSTTTIKYWNIVHESQHIAKVVSKENALSNENDRYVNVRFHIGCFTFSGKNAYYMGRKYRSIHQDNAIA